jgi:hypothetical protein
MSKCFSIIFNHLTISSRHIQTILLARKILDENERSLNVHLWNGYQRCKGMAQCVKDILTNLCLYFKWYSYLFQDSKKSRSMALYLNMELELEYLLYCGRGYFLRGTSREVLHCSHDLSNENSLGGTTGLPSCQETSLILEAWETLLRYSANPSKKNCYLPVFLGWPWFFPL